METDSTNYSNLTAAETQEIQSIEHLKFNNIPLSQKLYNRYKYLINKEGHNCCWNPTCTGYKGTEEEIVCPKCGDMLMKSI